MKLLLVSLVALIICSLTNTAFPQNIFILPGVKLTLEDTSSCAYKIIDKQSLQEFFAFNCNINAYEDAEKTEIVLTYQVSGSWNTQYSQGKSGWYWRITQVGDPKSKIVYIASWLVPYIKNGTVDYAVKQISDQHETLTVNR